MAHAKCNSCRRNGFSAKLVLALLIGAAAVFAALALNLRSIYASIAAADPAKLIVALGLFTLAQAAFALRWRALLPEETRPRRVVCGGYLLIGGLLNNLLPMRAGDLTRGVLVSRSHHIPLGDSAAVIVIERLADAAMVALAGIGLLMLHALPERATQGIAFFGASVLVVGLALWALSRISLLERVRAKAWVHKVVAPIKTLLMDALAAGKRTLRGRAALGALGPHCFGWFTVGMALATCMSAVHLQLPQPAAVLAVIVMTSVSGLIVAAPLGVGPWHALAAASLALFGLPTEAGIAFAIVAHGLATAVLLIGGTASVWVFGVKDQVSGLVQSIGPKRRCPDCGRGG